VKSKLKLRLKESMLDWLFIAKTLPVVFIKKLPWMVAIFFASWAFVYFMKTTRDGFRGFLNGL
jgi:hypothetical protein